MKIVKKLIIIFGILFIFFIIFCFYKKDFPFINEYHVSGQSMYPTIKDGEWIFANPYREPKIGDIVSFDCLSDKCMNKLENGERVKRLTDIDTNYCFYVLGDNREHSNDSSDYGALCPADIKLNGVVFFHF